MPEGGLDAEKWLREHTLCSLATGRRDGSPQLSLVSYGYDGTDIVISTCTDRPKWSNSKRQSKVALLVQDGRQYVLVYGRAEHVESDPERLEAMKRIPSYKRRLEQAAGNLEGVIAELDAEKRVVLRVVPEQIVAHS
jgi:PPOX class probable F420-dependent enzyme